MQPPHDLVHVSSRQDQAIASQRLAEPDPALFVRLSGGAPMSNESSIFGNMTKLGGTPIVSNSPTPSLANEPARESLAVRPASKNTINRESPGQRGCGTQAVGMNIRYVDR